MALVAYDNSDTSEYEDDENEGQSTGLLKESSVTIEATKVTAVARDNDSNSEEPQTLFNELPLPSSKKKTVIEEDDEFLHKKEADPEIKSKSKITIPSLSDFKDVEKTVPNTKAKTLNGKKSGLLSMLPQPKNAVKSSIKSLIPNSVAQKPPQPKTLPVQKMKQTLSPTKINKVNTSPTIVTEYSDESDDDIQNDFFSINKPVDISEDIPLDIENKTEKVENTKSQPRSLESYFKKDINVEQECHIQPQVSDYSDSVQNIDNTEQQTSDVLDEEAILKLVGARGKRKREEIQIVDVNQQEVLNDAREWLLKGLMDDTTKRQSVSKKRGNEPTNQQKRKHQITYLAHQAKANEAELQNQWANNRMTKRQTQSKYGF